MSGVASAELTPKQRQATTAILVLFAIDAAWRVGVGSGSNVLLVSAVPALWLTLAVRWRRLSLVAVGASLVAIGSVLLFVVLNLVAWGAVLLAARAASRAPGAEHRATNGPPLLAVLTAGALSALLVAGGVRCPSTYAPFYNDSCGESAPTSVEFPLPDDWRISEGPDLSCGSGGCATLYVVAAPGDVEDVRAELEQSLTSWRNTSETTLQFLVVARDEGGSRDLESNEAVIFFSYEGWGTPVFDLPWNG